MNTTFSLEQVNKLIEALEAIRSVCSDVNWCSHNQMKDAINDAFGIADTALCQLPNIPVLSAEEGPKCTKDPNTCQVAFCNWPNDCVTSDNKASAPVASHTASFCNSIEEIISLYEKCWFKRKGEPVFNSKLFGERVATIIESDSMQNIDPGNFKTEIRNSFSGWQAGFTIGHQTFWLASNLHSIPEENTEEWARWMEVNLQTALKNLQNNGKD